MNMAQSGKASAKRSKPSYFMAILGVAFVLLILGVIGWMLMNAKKMGEYFKENIEVRVYLRENISTEDSSSLVTYISSKPYVKSYEYITKEKAKEKFIADGNRDWTGVLDQNPLPASIEFKIRGDYAQPDSLDKIKADLQENINVSDVQYPRSLVANLNNIIRKASLILLGIAAILGILVIFLIDNTIRLAMFSNRFLIKTMQMVGATRWFIARPLDLRAVVNGAISGLIAVAGMVAVILVSESLLPELKALRDYNILTLLFSIIILMGIGISLASTHLSVIKYLKMKLDDLY